MHFSNCHECEVMALPGAMAKDRGLRALKEGGGSRPTAPDPEGLLLLLLLLLGLCTAMGVG